jgi:hypothetical protein
MNTRSLCFNPDPAAGGSTPPAPVPAAAPAAPPAGFVSQDEHIKILEKARSDEKAKLYDKMKEQEASAKRLEGELKAAEDKIQTLEGKLSAIEKAKTKDGVDVEKLVNEVSETTRKQAEQAYSKQITELQGRLQVLEGQNRDFSLQQTRQAVIAEMGGEKALIVEMVAGTTEEEIRASAQRAKATFDRIRQNAIPAGNPGTPPNTNGHVPPGSPALPPATPPGGGAGTPDAELNKVRTMSPTEYAKHREEVLRRTNARYSGGGLVRV